LGGGGPDASLAQGEGVPSDKTLRMKASGIKRALVSLIDLPRPGKLPLTAGGARGLDGVGQKIGAMIAEFAESGEIREVEDLYSRLGYSSCSHDEYC